jgi:hypothetical protein
MVTVTPPVVGAFRGATRTTDGGAYELATVDSADVCPPTVTIQRIERPVPGTVLHVMVVWSVVTAQPTAVSSEPDDPYVTELKKACVEKKVPEITTASPPFVEASRAPGPERLAMTGAP